MLTKKQVDKKYSDLRALLNKLIESKKWRYIFASQIVTAIIGILAGKLIAVYIAPEVFGEYNLQMGVFTLLFSIFLGPAITYVKVSYQGLLPNIGARPFLYLLTFMTVIMLIITSIAIMTVYDGDMILYLFIILVLLLLSRIVSSIISDQFMVLDLIKFFSFHSIVKAFGGLLFLWYVFSFIYDQSNGTIYLWGWQIAIGLFGIIIFVPKLNIYWKDYDYNWHKFQKNYMAFAGPLIILSIWSWLNNYFDRYAIDYFLDTYEVGIYNANYGLGSKIFLLLHPIFLVTLTPHVYQDNTNAERKLIIKKYFKNYVIVGLIIMIGVYFFYEFIGSLLLSDMYSSGFYVIFWISLVYLILTATELIETIFYATHNTKVIMYANIYSALVNIFLNIIFIPILGLPGAIVAMIASVVIRIGYSMLKFKNL